MLLHTYTQTPIHTQTHSCTNTFSMFTLTCTYGHTLTCIDTGSHLYMYSHTHVHIYVQMNTLHAHSCCSHTHIHPHRLPSTLVYTYLFTLAHTHTHVYMLTPICFHVLCPHLHTYICLSNSHSFFSLSHVLRKPSLTLQMKSDPPIWKLSEILSFALRCLMAVTPTHLWAPQGWVLAGSAVPRPEGSGH